MKRVSLAVLALIPLLFWTASLPVHAASTYKPCSLLTAAELEAVVRAKVTSRGDDDYTFPEGPLKGETVSSCGWTMGSGTNSGTVGLSVQRIPQTPAQRAAATAIYREPDEALRKQGWKIEYVNIGKAECAIYRPPAGPNAPGGAGCVIESKGFWFTVLIINASVPVTPQQVKALADKAAARFP